MSEKIYFEQPNEIEMNEIVDKALNDLPELAREIIAQNSDLREDRNWQFFKKPNDPIEHAPKYHQWGIITHTKQMLEFYHDEILAWTDCWGIKDLVEEHMNEEIDGRKKSDLFDLAIVLHDIGKFATRKIIEKGDKNIINFPEHAEASGKIIRSPGMVKHFIKKYGLTEVQIEYIARCAELHYKLDYLRKNFKKKEMLRIADFQVPRYRGEVERIMDECNGYELEVGLIYWADTLGKTDIRVDGRTDKEVFENEKEARREIAQRGINKKLVASAMQLPANQALVEGYLKIWAEKEREEQKTV
jgi:hypothetical protein